MSIQGFGSLHPMLPLSLQDKIGNWALSESQNPKNANFLIEQTKCDLLSFLANPKKEDLCLTGVCLENLYPILSQPPFADRLKTLDLQQCSMTDDCDVLDGFLANIAFFPNLKKLSFSECAIATFPQAFWEHQNLETLQFTECPLSQSSFDPIQAILHSQNLTSLQINTVVLSVQKIRQQLNHAMPVLQELYKNDLFKETLFDYLAFANEDALFRETFFAIMAPERFIWNETQYAFSITLVDQAARLRQAQRQGILPYARYLTEVARPLELLRDFTERKAMLDPSLDPIVIYRAYLEQLQLTRMVKYFAMQHSLLLSGEDLDMAKTYIANLLCDEESTCQFLIHKPNWTDLLSAQFPAEYNAARKQGSLALYFCQIELTKRVLAEIAAFKQEMSFAHSGGKRTLGAETPSTQLEVKRTRGMDLEASNVQDS